jgi:hypothetical protein
MLTDNAQMAEWKDYMKEYQHRRKNLDFAVEVGLR